jgi:hypothetical protein
MLDWRAFRNPDVFPTMNTTIFDVRIRTVECERCGAPVECPRNGGNIPCRYCGSINAIATRSLDVTARKSESMAESVARMGRLKSQLDSPLEGHPYDLERYPMGWSEEALKRPDGYD